MFAYAMYRHHPNPRVGWYTQQAAYIFYTLAGLLLPLLALTPKDTLMEYWWVIWGVTVFVVVPLAIYQIMKVHSEEWTDVILKP